ncbi:hypothetical protein [Dyella sp. 20L07]|uniref:hypothetical protein n=1 Tax=Dyella sp. 20L07 TaxID=3384240 RepID=UPI003D2B1BED
MIRWIMAFACLAVSACSQQAMLDKLTPHPQSELAKQVLDEIRAKQFDAVKARFDDNLLQLPDIDNTLQQVANYFPSGTLINVRLVGTNTVTGPRGTSYNLTYEYQFADTWALANVHLHKQGDVTRVDGFHVERMSQSLEQANAFHLDGKSPAHWLVLALVIALPLFCLYALVLCIRTPIPRRKWLWAIFTLIGVVTFHFNWNTGAYGLQLISLQLFSAAATQTLFGPTILSVAFPLGAICFLAKRKDFMRRAEVTTESRSTSAS